MADHRPARWTGKRSVPATGGVRPATASAPPPVAPSIDATDAARALAAEHGIELSEIEHSGDRIVKGDVERHLNELADPSEPDGPNDEDELESDPDTPDPA